MILKLNINVKKRGGLRILLRKKFCFPAISSNFAENETRIISAKSFRTKTIQPHDVHFQVSHRIDIAL